MRKLLAAFVACGTLYAGAAQAVTVSDSLPLSSVELDGVLSVAQFDPTLGTLTGISFKITGLVESLIELTNRSQQPVEGSAFVKVDFDLTSPLLPVAGSPDFSVLASTGLQTLPAGETGAFLTSGSTVFEGVLAPSAAFIGGGFIDLAFKTASSFGASGFGGDIRLDTTTTAGLDFEIVYEFVTAQVPLPASAPLLAAAAGLLGFFSLRRARAARV